jgi:hypothetical protein
MIQRQAPDRRRQRASSQIAQPGGATRRLAEFRGATAVLSSAESTALGTRAPQPPGPGYVWVSNNGGQRYGIPPQKQIRLGTAGSVIDQPFRDLADHKETSLGR